MITLIVGCTGTLLAALVQGCAGFGMGMISVSSLMLVLPPAEAVPVTLLLSTVNTGLAAYCARGFIDKRLVATLSAAAAVGMAFGMVALHVVPVPVYRFSVGTVVFLFALVLLSGWRKPMPWRPAVFFPVGMLSGFMGGSSAMSGPPVVLFLANQTMRRDNFRASLLAYFFMLGWIFYALNFAGGLLFGSQGLFSAQVFKYAAVFLLPMLGGTLLGMRLAPHVPDELFRNIAIGIVAVMGLLLLVTGIRGLW